jgi:peptidoglycan/xylan/chitin deacetylase (PgdA/CDA1 family)
MRRPRSLAPAAGWSAQRLRVLGVVLALLQGCSGILVPDRNLLRNVYFRGPSSSAAVALTFDDGPNGRCTEAVLDALWELGVPATFFVVGRNVAAGHDDALLARMVREGHTIGIHSHTHSVRRALVRRLTIGELRAARTAVQQALARSGVHDPPAVTLFRPPFGLLTTGSAEAIADAGLTVIEWTVSVRDWEKGRGGAAIAADVLARVRAGDVIVLHDGNGTRQRSRERCRDRAAVAEAVRILVPALAARGLRPSPLQSLLGLPDAPASGGLRVDLPTSP